MKNKYFITWNYSYDCYSTNRFETYKIHGLEFKRAYFPITYSGTRKSVIELNNEMLSKEWEQFIKNFEDKKTKAILKQDIEHRDHTKVSITNISKL